MIISSESKWKSIFDIWVLLLVGYSCISSLYYVAFSTPDNLLHKMWDVVVEVFFYLDLILNFFQAFVDTDTEEEVRSYKEIAKKYFWGWFIIDFVSVFPFDIIFSTGPMSKLFRLCRMPRLIKLIDVSRFDKLLKALMSLEEKKETSDKILK